MRRRLALLLVPVLIFVPACRQQPQGSVKVVVIGGEPKLRDPALGPLTAPDAVLLENVAQGLVRFDSSGNIVPGLAERWNVSDDGLSYIFRIASVKWPDGQPITAQQVAHLLKRQLAERSHNSLKDPLGSIDDVVAMTDRVIEVQLVAPRPNLLALLAQPDLAILRGSNGTGPFRAVPTGGAGGELRLTREVANSDEEKARREEILLAGAPAGDAIRDFAAAKTDVVLGGTFVDLPLTRGFRLTRNAIRFDPASGLFGLIPTKNGGSFDNPDVRHLLSEALDRGNFIAALGVPGLDARASLLEPGLDGVAAPAAPAWLGTPPQDRLAGLRARASKLLNKTTPVIRIFLPPGPGGDLLFEEISRDWSPIGLNVERAPSAATADFTLIDEVAPSTSPAWFIRRFRCDLVPVCDSQADQLMDAARQSPVPAQRYALLAEAAARIDDAQLFIPIAAPVRWSLVSGRVQNFAGNRYARHTLTDLQGVPANGD